MFITLIDVMVSWVYANFHTQQIIYIQYAQSLVYQLYVNKVVLQKESIKGLVGWGEQEFVDQVLKSKLGAYHEYIQWEI